MLKGVGLAIVCLSCFLLGLSGKRRIRSEVEIIKRLSALVVELMEEITYGKYPLGECFFRIGTRGEGELRRLFFEISEKCKGSRLHPLMIFTENLEDYLRKKGVSKMVRQELLSCIVIGNMEEDMQYKLLEQSAKRMERLFQSQEETSMEKEKLAVTLGVMGGCFFFLFFI